MTDNEIAILEQRDYKIIKANEIIQKARNCLSLIQLKTLAFILSKVKPTDKKGQTYTFQIKDFCNVCGIEEDSGKNYSNVKAALKGLRDKSFWIIDEDGKYVLVAWIEKPKVDPRSKKIEVKLDEDIQKYLIGWLERYTQYSLFEVIPMQSRYSFVLFELLKSYSNLGEYTFDIDDLKMRINATKYVNFKDFRIKVLEIATREINKYTEINISWEPETKGRKVVKIKFVIQSKTQSEKFKIAAKASDDQNNIFDYIEYDDRELKLT